MTSDLLVQVLVRELVNRGWAMEEENFVDGDGSVISVYAAVRRQVQRELDGAFELDGEPGLGSYDPDDPAQQLAHHVLEGVIIPALKREFANGDAHPNVTVVVAAPPTGRVGIGTTEPDPGSIMAALIAAQGMVRRAIRLQAGRN